MLRAEDFKQGTLQCRGRIDKMCAVEILWGIVEGRLLRLGIRLSIRLH